MYRNKINELINWKLSEYRKPLVVLGARQVGKTWLIVLLFFSGLFS